MSMDIRRFAPGDGALCHRLRRDALLEMSGEYLSAEAAQIAADSYSADDFASRVSGMETFVLDSSGTVAGFSSFCIETTSLAELAYLYINAGFRGIGAGSFLARSSLERVLSSHPSLSVIYLRTVVPEYNRRFWEKMGYEFTGPAVCSYAVGSLPAVRLEKTCIWNTDDCTAVSPL